MKAINLTPEEEAYCRDYCGKDFEEAFNVADTYVSNLIQKGKCINSSNVNIIKKAFEGRWWESNQKQTSTVQQTTIPQQIAQPSNEIAMIYNWLVDPKKGVAFILKVPDGFYLTDYSRFAIFKKTPKDDEWVNLRYHFDTTEQVFDWIKQNYNRLIEIFHKNCTNITHGVHFWNTEIFPSFDFPF